MVAKKNLVLKILLPVFLWSLLALLPGCRSSGGIQYPFSFIQKAGFTPGTYEGTAPGHRGPIRVRLQISQAGIDDIVIVSHRESAYPGAAAMEELLEEILETGSTDLDAVSGATFSSRGFLNAVEDAMRKASGAERRD